MQNDVIRVVFIGDVVGRYGRRFVENALPCIKRRYRPDVVIANGENSAGGLGIIKKTADEIFNAGVDMITSGNHVWDKKETLDLLKEEERVLRPLNYPQLNPGRGFYNYKIGDVNLMIINLQGRVFMEPVVDNPFAVIDNFLKQVDHKLILVDFHAEATAEKQAMGFFLDGRVSAVLGTHTHVQTTDLRILGNGTAYQTDVGMTGSLNSVIGMKKAPVVKKFVTGVNQRFEVAKGNMILDMTVLDIDKTSGRAVDTELLRLFDTQYEKQLAT